MTTIGDGVESSNTGVLVPAFAKLQGENFEYYMRKYSIMLGRNSKKKSVDLDLRDLGGGMDISRHHARIYYDFTFRCFALEVIGRNGCIIKNVLFMPGNPPIKLDSQDLLQIGEVRFYFLLPTRSFFETLEAALQIAPPLPPQLVVVPPTSSNDERKGEEREGDREGIGHGEGGVSGPIVQGSNAREAEGSAGILSGGLEAGRQIPPPLPPPLVAVPLASSNDERKGEEKEGNREESLGIRHVEVDVSGLIVDEFNAREAERPSGVLCGALEAVRKIAPPLPPPLVVVPPTSNDEWKGEEREGNREESQGIDHGEGISGLIVDEGNAREAGSSSRELSGAFKGAGQIVPPPPPQLVVVPRASNDDRKGEEKEGDMKESALEAAGQIVPPPLRQLVVVLRASNDDNRKGEEKEGDMEESALEAAGQIVPPPPPQLVAVPHASNDDRKCEEKEGSMEESPGVEHCEGNVSGLIVEEFNGGEADCSSGMLSGGIKQYSLSNENLEPRSSDREADNQEETPDVHVLKANLPGIKKEQIKLEVVGGKIWIQISAELISENEEKTDMWHCVENSSGKFLRSYFVLPENAKIDQIKATMEKGMLTVTVSKGKIEMPGQSVVRSIEISD